MTVTLDTLIPQPGQTADVTTGQMLAYVYAGGKEPAYERAVMERIVARWAYWSDFFGFLRSLTFGQSCHETGVFWSRVKPNQVQPDQFNWGGLGADNSGAAGGRFGPHPDFAYEDPVWSAIDHGIVAFMAHLALYVFGEPEQWPEQLRPYAAFAYRLASVRWSHHNRRKPDGHLLGYLGVVKRPRDFLNGRWAETSRVPLGTLDNGYAVGIVAKANEIHAMKEPAMTTLVRVALAAGHHNTSGGNPVEHGLTGPITQAIAERLRVTPGFDVRVVTPNDGLGDYPGTLTNVAEQVVRWDREGWRVDLFLECHTEGNNSGDAGRGLFAIYPDWGADVDADVRDRLGPDLVARLSAATGIPLRRNGLMSEKVTGVGAQGYRLGVFKATESIRDHCTRLIIEFGAHTSPKDLAIMQRSDFPALAAVAVVDALRAFYGVSAEGGQAMQSRREFPTGYALQAGFLAFYESLGDKAWAVVGVPLSDEIPNVDNGDGLVTVQRTDVGWLQWTPATGEVRMATREQARHIERSLYLNDSVKPRLDEVHDHLKKAREHLDAAMAVVSK